MRRTGRQVMASERRDWDSYSDRRDAATRLGMCDCARTREYCVTLGCAKDEMRWSYTTEGRKQDRLRRVVVRDGRVPRPISRWVRPERAIAEAWRLNIEGTTGPHTDTTIGFIEKLGEFDLDTRGVP
jgi:hypothetical protein